jgi:hypothetical protein
MKTKDLSWMKKKQRLPVSDIAEAFVSVTDIARTYYFLPNEPNCT